MGVNSLPKTVTRRLRDCDLNPAPESSTLTTRIPSHPIEWYTWYTSLSILNNAQAPHSYTRSCICKLLIDKTDSHSIQYIKKITPIRFFENFFPKAKYFKPKFYLPIHIYVKLQNYTQLTLTPTKLCDIKRYPSVNFYISLEKFNGNRLSLNLYNYKIDNTQPIAKIWPVDFVYRTNCCAKLVQIPPSKASADELVFAGESRHAKNAHYMHIWEAEFWVPVHT